MESSKKRKEFRKKGRNWKFSRYDLIERAFQILLPIILPPSHRKSIPRRAGDAREAKKEEKRREEWMVHASEIPATTQRSSVAEPS